MKRSQLSIVLSMLAVFSSGALVGAFGHRLYTVRTVDAAPQRRSPSEYRQRYLTEMKTRLSLDDSQTARLSQALDRTRERFRTFNEKHKPEISAIHEEQTREIRALLTPEQQGLYEQYLKEREQKRKEYDRSR
jgi:hypothetical protein